MKLWVDNKIPAPDGYVWCKFYGDVTQNICDSEAKFGRSYRKGKIDESLLITEINIGTKFGTIAELFDWLHNTNREYNITYHENKNEMNYFVIRHNSSGFQCKTWNEFVTYLKHERDAAEWNGLDSFEVYIEDNSSNLNTKVSTVDAKLSTKVESTDSDVQTEIFG